MRLYNIIPTGYRTFLQNCGVVRELHTVGLPGNVPDFLRGGYVVTLLSRYMVTCVVTGRWLIVTNLLPLAIIVTVMRLSFFDPTVKVIIVTILTNE